MAGRDTRRLGVLNVVELTNGEYLISSVALGVEEYYLGVGEAPGVWASAWSERLGLSGEVDADRLRSLIDGRSPVTGEDLLAGWRPRRVKAFDLTFSAPKSVSLLWAFATPTTAQAVRAAHDEAVSAALGFLEERAAVARRQVDRVRRRVPTEGWAVAGFVHRTSREGDPQVHTHCLVPNIVRRCGDGRHVAIDANPLYDWARAAGSVYQNHLQRMLGAELGVRWGPDRNNTREIEGFTRAQLRGFSKRSVQIEAELEAQGASYTAPGLRMRADEAASLATRVDKDRSLTPANLAARWNDEAAELGLAVGPDLDAAVRRGRPSVDEEPTWGDVVAALVDADRGLCSRSARFGEADVVEHLCALSGGRWTTDQITEITARFLVSPHAVRLTPSVEGGHARRRPPQWSTAVHRALEDATLATLHHLTLRPTPGVVDAAVATALAASPELGDDQVDAVRVACGPGGSVRAVLSPAGFGKTAMVHTAARALRAAGRPVVAVATTAKAVGELEAAGLPAMTIAHLRIQLTTTPLAPGTAVVLDEVSQTSTGDAHTVLAAVAATPEATVIVLGDPRQAQSVKAGGLAAEIAHLATTGRIPTAELATNRRQHDPADRAALILLRGGRPAESQTLRAEHGWEHEHLTPTESRDALADAAVADIAAHGADQVGVLAVSHVDAEDLADRIRHRLQAAGAINGPAVVGPGWVTDRTYQAGDRVLLHTRHPPHPLLVNGAAGTITTVSPDGLSVRLDDGETARISATFVRGTKPDGSPNLSHAWARTIDGAQGGTWDACHLLGTNALDAYRGYTGQSRSRQPTHTYNTTAVPTLDHGGTLADQRTPSEQVLAALARQPDPTMAARSDPWPTERHLRSLIGEHQAALAAQPLDRTAAVRETARQLHEAERHAARVRGELDAVTNQIANQGPFSGISPRGRRDRDARHRRHRALTTALAEAEGALQRARDQQAGLVGEQAAHDRFVEDNRWRHAEINNLRDQLEHHWADVIVACARAGDPLAFGIDRLRHARRRLHTDLQILQATIPPDRQLDLRLARKSRADAAANLHASRLAIPPAEEALAEASRRRWGLRDPQAITTATQHLHQARRELARSSSADRDAADNLARVREHQQRHQHALGETAPRRFELTRAVADLDAALEHTRPERVNRVAARPDTELRHLLGDPPDTPAGRAVWSHYALIVETVRDHEPNPTNNTWHRISRACANCQHDVALADLANPNTRDAVDPEIWAACAARAHQLGLRGHAGAARAEHLNDGRLEVDFGM